MVTYHHPIRKERDDMKQVIDMKKTGEHLKQLCKQHGITIAELQAELHLKCPQSVYRWFKGVSLPSIDHLIVIAYILRLPIEELIVLKDADISEEHISDIIRWSGDKAANSEYLRKAYWEVFGILIL